MSLINSSQLCWATHAHFAICLYLQDIQLEEGGCFHMAGHDTEKQCAGSHLALLYLCKVMPNISASTVALPSGRGAENLLALLKEASWHVLSTIPWQKEGSLQ